MFAFGNVFCFAEIGAYILENRGGLVGTGNCMVLYMEWRIEMSVWILVVGLAFLYIRLNITQDQN